MDKRFNVYTVRTPVYRVWIEKNVVLFITLVLMCTCGLLGACASCLVGFATGSLAMYACAIPDGSFSLGVIALAGLLAGGIVVFVAALGACAAWGQRGSMLMVVAILLWVLAITEFAVGVGILASSYDQLGFSHQGKQFSGTHEFLDVELHRSFEGAFGKHRRRNHTAFEDQARLALESLQRDFACCGVHGPGDFADLATPVPATCMVDGHANARGCVFALRAWIGRNVVALGVVLLLAGLVSAAGSLSSTVLIRTRLRWTSRRAKPVSRDLDAEALSKLNAERERKAALRWQSGEPLV